MTELAWHVTGDILRDGSAIPPDGEWLRYSGKCVMCESGLHASRRLIDALRYAPGSTICRVAAEGIAFEQDDKLVCSRRLIVWRLENSDELLRAFARKVALSVIHLWAAPAVVCEYLETGNEKLRAAARDAAWAAARDAARDAAWDAARDAAWAAARDAAWAAARDAAWDAAWAAASVIEKFNTELEALVREAAGNPLDEIAATEGE